MTLWGGGDKGWEMSTGKSHSLDGQEDAAGEILNIKLKDL